MIIDKVNYRQRSNGKWEVNYLVVDGINRYRKFKGGFKTKGKATDFIKSFEMQLIHGEVKLDDNGDPITGATVKLTDFIETYLDNATLHKRDRSRVQDRIDLKNFSNYFPDGKELHKITTFDLEQFISGQIKAKRSLYTTNREITTVKRLFNHAVKWGSLQKNPAAVLKKMRLPEGDVQYLNPDEQRKLLLACRAVSYPDISDDERPTDSPYLYPLVMLALRTGMRKGELFHLKWKHVDFEEGRILIINQDNTWFTKSGKSRYVPLDAQLTKALLEWKEWFDIEINRVSERQDRLGLHAQLRTKAAFREKTLRACKPNSNRYVFPSFKSFDDQGEAKPLDNITKAWKRALLNAFGTDTGKKKNGVNIIELPERYDLGLHALRHSFAVACAINNVPLALLSKILGHSDLKTTQIYLRFYPADAARLISLPCIDL